MLLVELLSGALVTTGASMLLVGGIGLVLTRSEERMEKEDAHERENQQTGA